MDYLFNKEDTQQVLVSVVMSTYNEKEEWIEKAINSILNQTYRNIEFIIVLDNPDNEVIRDTVNRFAGQDGRIKIIENETNSGLVKSLNKALEVCKGQYIARMDADDISAKNRIEEQLMLIRETGSDLVGARVVFIDEDNSSMFGEGEKLHYADSYIKKTLAFQNCIYHPTWFVKKELYEQLNGYRNVSCCEDYDFLLRAKIFGARFAVSPKVLVNYRYNTQGISRSNKARQRCITLYMRSVGVDLNDITVEMLNEFPNTDRGRKILNDCEKYYTYSQLAIDAKSCRNKIGMIGNVLKCILLTKNGRIKACDSLRDIMLLWQENH